MWHAVLATSCCFRPGAQASASFAMSSTGVRSSVPRSWPWRSWGAPMNQSAGLPQPPAHVHFVGIGGIGKSALARILATRGYTVTGSDAFSSDLVEQLRQEGIGIHIGHQKDRPWQVSARSGGGHGGGSRYQSRDPRG